MSTDLEIETPRVSSNEQTPLNATTSSNYTDILDTFPSEPVINVIAFYKRPIFWFKLCIVLMLFVVFVIAAVYYEEIFDKMILPFILWIERHPVQGIFAYLLYCWVWLTLLGPETVLTVGAGFVFTHAFGTKGIPIAIALVFTGTQIGATQCFINGRYLMRNCTQNIANRYPQFKIIDQVVQRHGLKMTFLLRLTPLTPYNVMNYFMGITSISLWHYIIGNFGIIPDCVVMCFFGSFLSSVLQIKNVSSGLSKNEKKAMLIFSIVGTILAVIAAFYVGYIAKKQFKKMAEQTQLEKQQSDITQSDEEKEEEAVQRTL